MPATGSPLRLTGGTPRHECQAPYVRRALSRAHARPTTWREQRPRARELDGKGMRECRRRALGGERARRRVSQDAKKRASLCGPRAVHTSYGR
jgi:hypothetical protein